MYLAIDIGGTKTLLAVFDSRGKVIFEHKTLTDKNYSQFIKDIASAVGEELKDYSFSYCCCAAPGLIDYKDGVVKRFGNLTWINVPLQKDLGKILGHVPVLVENDANLAGLYEAALVHKKYNKVLYLTISTGIGGGVIVNGKLDVGLMHSEPGHMMLRHNGKIATWESFASGRAFASRYGKLASEVNDPKIWSSYAQELAIGIDPLLAVIQPDVVILGGGLGGHFDKFSKPLHEALEGLKNRMVSLPPIIKADRPEEAVIYGCYQLIKQQS